MKIMIEDVTNSPKDWDDFWYNSKDITPTKVSSKSDNVRCYIDNEEVDCQTWEYIKPHRTIHNYLT